MMELTIGLATIFHRYHFVLEEPDGEVSLIPFVSEWHGADRNSAQLRVHEGFLRKPECVHVGMQRRGTF